MRSSFWIWEWRGHRKARCEQALEADEFQAVAFGIRNLDNCWAFAPRLYFDEVRELVGNRCDNISMDH